jgi:uncharacterized lipoprotein YmbA
MMRGMTLFTALLVLAGCQSSPAPALYTLAARPGPVVASRPMSVELRRIGLAGYLDRPEIVRGTVQYRLTVSDGDRWGEPLGRMLDRVLTEDLVERLPNASVFAESGAISTRADTVVELDIQRCDADPDGSLVLLAQMAIRPDGKPARAQTLRLVVRVSGPQATAHVAAISEALGQLADRVAAILAET